MITVEVNKQQEEKPKDIFFEGNILTAITSPVVVLFVKSNNESFEAVVLKSAVSDKINGRCMGGFAKSDFRQFTGTITITSK